MCCADVENIVAPRSKAAVEASMGKVQGASKTESQYNPWSYRKSKSLLHRPNKHFSEFACSLSVLVLFCVEQLGEERRGGEKKLEREKEKIVFNDGADRLKRVELARG